MASSTLPILFLLLLATASISSAMDTIEEEFAPSPLPPHFQDEKINWGRIIPSFLKPKRKPSNPQAPKRKGDFDVDFGKCLGSIASVAGCRAELEFAKFMHMNGGKACCDSLAKVGENCFSFMEDWVRPLVKDQCQ